MKYILIGLIIIILLSYALIPSSYYKLKYKLTRKKVGKTLYLTFDDGPSIYTNELLEVLKEYHIQASFFCVADFALKYPEIIKRLKKEGHLIAMHSKKHDNAHLMTKSKTDYDFKESLNIMKSLGLDIKYYRPPWGDLNIISLKNIRKYKLHLILWHVMAEDWQGKTTSQIIAGKLLRRIKENDIICLHDGRGKNNAPTRTIAALKEVLPILLEKGYKFETVDKYEI